MKFSGKKPSMTPKKIKILLFVALPALLLNLFFLNATWNFQPGQVVPDSALSEQATKIGSVMDTHQQLFRIDTRAEDIIAKDGFLPNPNKPAADLAGHVAPEFGGSGNFVSTSGKQANPYNLLGSDFIGTPHPDNPDIHAEYPTDQPAPKPYRTVIKEYMIENQVGVLIPDNVGIPGEAEVTTNKVAPEKIIAVREIVLNRPWRAAGDDWVLDLMKKSTVEVGDWRPLQSSSSTNTKPVISPGAEKFGDEVTNKLKSDLEKQGLSVSSSAQSDAAKKIGVHDEVVVNGPRANGALTQTGKTLTDIVNASGPLRINVSNQAPKVSADGKSVQMNYRMFGNTLESKTTTIADIQRAAYRQAFADATAKYPVYSNPTNATQASSAPKTLSSVTVGGAPKVFAAKAGVAAIVGATLGGLGNATEAYKAAKTDQERNDVINRAATSTNENVVGAALVTAGVAGATYLAVAVVATATGVSAAVLGTIAAPIVLIAMIPMTVDMLTEPETLKGIAATAANPTESGTVGWKVMQAEFSNGQDFATNMVGFAGYLKDQMFAIRDPENKNTIQAVADAAMKNSGMKAGVLSKTNVRTYSDKSQATAASVQNGNVTINPALMSTQAPAAANNNSGNTSTVNPSTANASSSSTAASSMLNNITVPALPINIVGDGGLSSRQSQNIGLTDTLIAIPNFKLSGGASSGTMISGMTPVVVDASGVERWYDNGEVYNKSTTKLEWSGNEVVAFNRTNQDGSISRVPGLISQSQLASGVSTWSTLEIGMDVNSYGIDEHGNFNSTGIPIGQSGFEDSNDIQVGIDIHAGINPDQATVDTAWIDDILNSLGY